MLRGYASRSASGVCFARAPPSTNTYLGPREKILTHIYIYIIILKINHKDMLKKMLNKTEKITKTCHQKTIFHKSDPPQFGENFSQKRPHQSGSNINLHEVMVIWWLDDAGTIPWGKFVFARSNWDEKQDQWTPKYGGGELLPVGIYQF